MVRIRHNDKLIPLIVANNCESFGIPIPDGFIWVTGTTKQWLESNGMGVLRFYRDNFIWFYLMLHDDLMTYLSDNKLPMLMWER